MINGNGAHHLIAITDAAMATGTITYWHLAGELNQTALAAAWLEAGLDAAWLPEPPSQRVALTRALATMRTRGRVIAKLKNGASAVAVLKENETAEEIESRIDARMILAVRIEEPMIRSADDPKFVLRFDMRDDDGEAHAEADTVRELWVANASSIAANDVSQWLAALMVRLDGVSLRESGGVYFVPAVHADMWRKIVRLVGGAGKHTIHNIPAMKSDETVEAVLAAVEQEAAAHVARMQELLQADDLGERFLRSRLRETDEVAAKVSRYDDLLGRKLEALRDRLIETQASLMLAETVVISASERGAA